MAHFGLYKMGRGPFDRYEGDYMTQEGEYVKIFRNSNIPSKRDEQVGAIRLDKGQSVKQITDKP
jgi:hypothetical protein